MYPKKYNNLLTSRKCPNKNTKDDHILSLVGVYQKLEYDSKKSSEKSNTSSRESTKGELAYTRDLPPWILEEPKLEWEIKPSMERNISSVRNNAMAKTSGYATGQKITGSGPLPHQ